ncbi:DUF3800 domain-containing protein [Lacrimispora sp.]|uniref:DUF3800 domain-containing protein n=1 Tax=Lacrimispora sp. TaxID=2719234 RepID=UPI0028A8AAAF|nr:DUF3800 domain-containing protein [Lacrimispora sp.]
MSEYNFYYDESEHSRKINPKTITADNYYDNFITVVVGWRSEYETDLSNRYTAFEEKYKYRQSKGELKSTTIRQSQLEHGFASLNNDNVSLLEDFLALFNEKTLIYYAVISKIEYIIRQLFKDYKNSFLVDMDAMKYSITKAVVLYQPADIINGFYENTGELVTLLKKFFAVQIEKDKANEILKEKEIEQYNQILILLDDVSIIKTIDWNYDISFYGFKKYLNERSIDNYSLTIDKEGENGKTAIAAERGCLTTVAEADSITSCGIRMADMLAGLISKLLKSLHNALRYTSEEEQVSKKILNSSWFVISEQQLSLYKKLHNVAVDLNTSWYKSFSGIYSDDLIVFIAFLNFMSHFESVEAIKSDICMQGEYFNAYACECLSDYYTQMHHKLPIEPVGKASKDYFLNQQGAKVYFDITKQPLLEITKDRIVCDALAVGCSQEMIPLITIVEAGNVNCYRLPIALSEWAMTIVGFADMGENLFPSKVVFTKVKDGLYADIL